MNIQSIITIEKEISYEEGIKIVNEALSPLGKDYLKTFNKLLETNCVDVYPKAKKRSGAYQWGAYGVDPYVSGSDQMCELLTNGVRDWVEAAYTVEKDLDKLGDLMIERIEEKRAALGI